MYPVGSDMLLVSIKKLFVVGHGCYSVYDTGSSSPCSINIIRFLIWFLIRNNRDDDGIMMG